MDLERRLRCGLHLGITGLMDPAMLAKPVSCFVTPCDGRNLPQ